MPNWCDNDVAISGPKEDIDVLETLLDTAKYGFDCGLFVPYPDAYQNTEDEELKKEGYWWRVDNWGTTRTGDSGRERVDETHLSMWFDTAWGPAIPTILAMSKKFPSLEIDFMYSESLMDFTGHIVFSNGQVQEEWASFHAYDESEEEEDEEKSGYWGGIYSSSGSPVDLPLDE